MKYRLRRQNLQSGKEPVPDGPVSAGAVSVRRAATGPAQGAVLGRRRLSAAV